jgi:nicotinate-nucleotide pyrophosphorylase (carboxylating)
MIDFSMPEDILDNIITLALKEDVGNGDITTNALVALENNARAVLTAKENGVIAGLLVAEKVFKKLDANINWKTYTEDGKSVNTIFLFYIIIGQITDINFLQRMSGIATQTKKFTEALKGTKTKILDTRKTAPGLRLFDKYAVKCGGGTNHRIGLFDMVLIKDNHIKAAGSITEAVRKVRESIKPGIKIEVETTNFDEVNEALSLGVDVIMLDNMNSEKMKTAVGLINGKCLVEASGNISLENVRQVAETGVDFISVGALTHSVKALDISLNII